MVQNCLPKIADYEFNGLIGKCNICRYPSTNEPLVFSSPEQLAAHILSMEHLQNVHHLQGTVVCRGPHYLMNRHAMFKSAAQMPTMPAASHTFPLSVPMTHPATPRRIVGSSVAAYDSSSAQMAVQLAASHHVDNIVNDFGAGYCKVCNLTLKSKQQAIQHVNGKRHAKNLKLNMNVSSTSSVVSDSDDVASISSDISMPTEDGRRLSAHNISGSGELSASPLSMVEKYSRLGKNTKWIYCNVCGVGVNSEEQDIVHRNGKKHIQKVLELKRSETPRSGVGGDVPTASSTPAYSGTPIRSGTPVCSSTPIHSSTPIRSSTPMHTNTPACSNTSPSSSKLSTQFRDAKTSAGVCTAAQPQYGQFTSPYISPISNEARSTANDNEIMFEEVALQLLPLYMHDEIRQC